MQIGIKVALRSWGRGAKLICHRVKRLVEWIPKGSGKRYPYLAGDVLNCERWQGRGRCLYFLDEVEEGEPIACFVNDGYRRWVALIEPREGVGDRMVTGTFELTTYNGDIIADNTSLEDRENELKRFGKSLGYSFLKDPRNLLAVYALKKGIVQKLETCVEESPQQCRIW